MTDYTGSHILVCGVIRKDIMYWSVLAFISTLFVPDAGTKKKTALSPIAIVKQTRPVALLPTIL
jgi:hypothetical protein